MTTDPLAVRLRQADAAAPPPRLRAALAETVRARARARSRRRAAGAAALVTLAAGWSAWVTRDRAPVASPVAQATSVTPAPPPAPADLRSEISRLRAESDARLAAVAMLRVRRASLPPSSIDASSTARAEREKAALAMVDHADRLRRDLKQVDAALSAYRRTVELFPDTRWAAVARRRIEQLGPGVRRPVAEPLYT